MGRRRDTFWNYAHPESNKRFKCNFCNEIFPGGISRIKSHLSGIEGRDIRICLKVSDHIRAEAKQAINGVRGPPCKKKGKTTISISDDDENVVVVGRSSPCKNKGGKSSTAVAASNDDGDDDDIVVIEDEATLLLTCSSSSRESRKKELDKQFLKCYQIADAVSKEASQLLVQLVKGVSEFGPNYELPNFLTTPPDGRILEYEKVVKESWREIGCTLVITPVDHTGGSDEEVNVFGYCPKGMVLLTSGNLATAYTHISGVIEEFGDCHFLQVIAPIAPGQYSSTTAALAQMIGKSYPGLSLTCLSAMGVLRSLVTAFIVFVDEFHELLNAVESIFTYMLEFSLEWRGKIFSNWKKHKGLECNIYPTAFSADLVLLRVIMEHEAEVVSAVQSFLTTSHQHAGIPTLDVVMTEKFWRMGKELIHIIDILFPLVRLGQDMVPAFGYFYQAVNKACDAIEDCYHKDPSRYNKFKSAGCHGLLRKIISPIHAAACLLNPAIMCGDNFNEDHLMKEGIDHIADVFVVESERASFLDQVELYRAKTPSIFTPTAYKKLKTLHPWGWWREFGDSVPLLQKWAIRFLSQPCDVPLGIPDLPTANNASDRRRKMKLLLMEIFSGLQPPSSLEPIKLPVRRQTTEYDDDNLDEYLDDSSWLCGDLAPAMQVRP